MSEEAGFAQARTVFRKACPPAGGVPEYVENSMGRNNTAQLAGRQTRLYDAMV